jgi:predicted RNA-binding Zn-ribbon protein involved in translation (DUF1610 family)
MDDEANCNCQRCGQSIAFPINMHGQDVPCPHCGRETTLTLPMVRKAAPAALTPSEKPMNKNGERQLATKILMVIITIAAIAIAILIYNWRVNSLTNAMSGVQLP